jgi:ribosomal protein S18 acetylase RimI-like enzyme
MEIRRGNVDDVAELARLFDLYRQFYECESDLELATQFISDRIGNDESTLFVANGDGQGLIGFVQLYPTFCSVQAAKIFILYDLFVDSSVRNAGVGAQLMQAAAAYAKDAGAARVDLRTAFTNKPGQHLYEKVGYRKVLEDFHTYSLQL